MQVSFVRAESKKIRVKWKSRSSDTTTAGTDYVIIPGNLQVSCQKKDVRVKQQQFSAFSKSKVTLIRV